MFRWLCKHLRNSTDNELSRIDTDLRVIASPSFATLLWMTKTPARQCQPLVMSQHTTVFVMNDAAVAALREGG